MFGSHCVRSWSKAQDIVALSSAEAELYALVRATSEGIGLISLLKDLGLSRQLHVYADASAALAVVSRKGIGKIRHLDTRHLWVQDVQKRQQAEMKKIAGEKNPADILTKGVDRRTLDKHLEAMGIIDLSGRADENPELCS